MWKVQLFKLNYDERERNAAAAVIESGWLTMGERVMEFERAFATMLGGKSIDCVAVTNCTAALHMAVLAAGVQAGDEVLIPALTFVADANVVRMCGAEPILVDCLSYDDFCVDPADMERKITPKTKAVIVMHFAGYPCDMDRILAICEPRGIVVIEDAAHAPGATYKGSPLGTLGHMGCFSFFSNKNIAIGEGGMVTSRDPELAQRLRYLRSHGMTTLTLDRHKGRAFSYDVAQPGLNYRMDEIHAALGLVQLAKLDEGNRRRGELTRLYRQQLADSEIVMPFLRPQDGEYAYHVLPVLLPDGTDRRKVMEELKHEGIQSSIHYPSFCSFTAYKFFLPEATPLATAICARELTLPLYPEMTDAEVCMVTTALCAAVLREPA